MKVIDCIWRICPECEAPAGQDLPPGGSFTIEKRDSGIDKVITHYEGCSEGFKKIEIPDVE